MNPAPHSRQPEAPVASQQQPAALSGEVLRAERPSRYFEVDLANLAADRFLAERASFFRACTIFIYPQDDNLWNKFAPGYKDDFEPARNKTCKVIEELENAAMLYEHRKMSGVIVNPAELLDTIDRGVDELKRAMAIANRANLSIAKDFGAIAEESPNQLVLVDGAPITPESILLNSQIREDRTRRMYENIVTWASSFQLGALENALPAVTNLNSIATGFCAGRTGVNFAEDDAHVLVDRSAAEFLIASLTGHMLQSVNRSVSRIVDTTLAKPEFWKMGDLAFNQSSEFRTLKEAMIFSPQTTIEVESPAQIAVSLEIPEIIKREMIAEQKWLVHEISILERFANSKGVGFEQSVDIEKGHLEVRLLFHRLNRKEIPAGEIPEPPILPSGGSSPVVLELPPFEAQTIEFQRRCRVSGDRTATPMVSIAGDALLSSRARFTIGEMLAGVDQAVAAFPEISAVVLEGKTSAEGSVRTDFEKAHAIATLTGFRGPPQFIPSTSRFAELWRDYPWESDSTSGRDESAGESAGGYICERSSSDTISMTADAALLVWNRDIWERALKLNARCRVSFLDLGTFRPPGVEQPLVPAHHLTPNLMLESLEPKIDLIARELGHSNFYLTIASQESGRRHEGHITHAVQFAGEEGVFARAVFDSRTSSFNLYSHSEQLVDLAVSAVWTALSVLPDKKRHRILGVADALANSSIRFHEQLVLELVSAVPSAHISDTEKYRQIVTSTVHRFFTDPATAIEVGKGTLNLRFNGELSEYGDQQQ